jgi:hypothetical protein
MTTGTICVTCCDLGVLFLIYWPLNSATSPNVWNVKCEMIQVALFSSHLMAKGFLFLEALVWPLGINLYNAILEIACSNERFSVGMCIVNRVMNCEDLKGSCYSQCELATLEFPSSGWGRACSRPHSWQEIDTIWNEFHASILFAVTLG